MPKSQKSLEKGRKRMPCIALALCFSLFSTYTHHPIGSLGTENTSMVFASPAPPLLGDYAGELREPRPRKDGVRHVDTPRLIRKLKELGVTQYFYLIWHAPTDWDDLRKEFLPAAKEAGIHVWVYLVPPSEARRKQSEPFGTDYVAWFRAIGSLSRDYSNLKGIIMDDFNHNLSFFTPNYVARMKQAGREMNPNLRFYPQIYYTALQPGILKKYRSLFDGVVMTFRDGKYRNTQRTRDLKRQIATASRLLKKDGLDFILMIHASKLSATPSNPSLRYVKESLGIGLDQLYKGNIQGLVTYVLQKEWFPEQRDRTACSGFGYGSLFIPPRHTPGPGGRGEIKQRIRPDRSGNYRLGFHHLSVYPRNLKKGQYMKQVLVDHRVVWEEDVRTGQVGQWKKKTLHLTPFLHGKKEALLTLRLLRKKDGSPAWLYTGFDQLEPTGFEVANPGFEERSGWSYLSNDPSVIGETLIFDPKRRLRVYLTTMMMYNTFHLHSQIQASGTSLLKKEADPILQFVLEGQVSKAHRRLNRLIDHLEGDTTLPRSKRESWLKQAKKLGQILAINP